MKKSGYRTIFHIYLIFFCTLVGTIAAAAVFFFLLTTVRKPDGTAVRSDWPKSFLQEFQDQIIFTGDRPQITQSGLEQLQEYEIGLQILDGSGRVVCSYQAQAPTGGLYSAAELLSLERNGFTENGETASFAETVFHGKTAYIYILHFPVKISKVTMYLNGEQFADGKSIVLTVLAVLFLTVLVSGIIYGLWSAGTVKRMTSSIRDIAARRYVPEQNRGTFRDLFDGLNALDAQIRDSDRLKEETETLRREWIANITHDLKTPLSPIKGYAEILLESGESGLKEGRCRRYAEIMLKNAAYMETLIDDLKLSYQLETDSAPVNRMEQDVVRFLKELVIGVLNTPEYETRTVHFECDKETILYSFDQTLFTRAFRNLIINAFVHGTEDTDVTVQISGSDTDLPLLIRISDNGKGMTPEETKHLFDRYYRGSDTGRKPEGTGLGLAIAKNIIELHAGTISVTSVPGTGTVFQIEFPFFKVN